MYERQQKPRGLKGFLASVFRGVDLARRLVVNGLFLLALLVLWALATSDGRPTVPESTALVVAPRGLIVEQLSGDPFDRAMQKLTGSEVPEALLKDLIDAVEAAGDDDRVKAVFLDLSQLLGATLPSLRALRTALDELTETGKPVIVLALAQISSEAVEIQ